MGVSISCCPRVSERNNPRENLRIKVFHKYIQIQSSYTLLAGGAVGKAVKAALRNNRLGAGGIFCITKNSNPVALILAPKLLELLSLSH